MIEIVIPGRDAKLSIDHLLLDINGTLTVDGHLIPGVKERIARLKQIVEVHLLTADTYGMGTEVATALGCRLELVDPNQGGLDKVNYLAQLSKEHTAAIGNGYNDIYMLDEAALGIAVIGSEGCSVRALEKADIVTNAINDALDLLLNPKRIVATLRA